MIDYGLKNKVALITGANNPWGIGEKLVDSGDYAVAFSMYPTTVGQLIDIADAGEIMPPKSTWFEPKLRDGLVSHNF